MENRGLLFIPDISGFTRFVNEIEIEHSRHIIQQLLELLINANESELEISEIEGDAILFYKFGPPPDIAQMYQQVEKMFCAFHRYLMAYDHRKICQCKACITAVDLTLKVITHYGEFTTYQVKNFSKLIGKDVIVAHQLLKNDIPQHEYWLVTDHLFPGEALSAPEWITWDSSIKQTESGDVPFHYAQLGTLKDNLIPEPDPQLELADKVKVLSVSRAYQVDIKTLTFTVVHFEFRHLWQPSIRNVEEVEHFLPGVGSRHRHVYTNGTSSLMYTSSFSYDPDRVVSFSETDQKRNCSYYYIIEKTGEHSARLTIDFYLHKNFLQQWLFRWRQKKKMEHDLQTALAKLEPLVMNITLPLDF
ncbi:DUF2652 domain-containing protein [Chitinophaga arvensicola]|uniref:DUF2652 domain-containing protein n=1 Tax=Chitinophaga arvensicola TaxID=29529 RepID=A0A1I0QCB1_9BACT|nr:DUF2652 domain-containing protein [Chitinophaga arvensicola]SEW24207.1 Protein of unknown function [Chitinophaga arvensicola]